MAVKPFSAKPLDVGSTVTWLDHGTVRTGEVWSRGPEISSIWVTPDDGSDAVALKITTDRGTKVKRVELMPVYSDWRSTLRALGRLYAARSAYVVGGTLHLSGCTTGQSSPGYGGRVSPSAAREIVTNARPAYRSPTPCRVCVYGEETVSAAS